MKVLYVTHYSNVYGANKSLLQLIIDLRENHGIKPFVIVPKDGPICEKFKENGISFQIVRYYNWLNSRDFFTRQLIRIINKALYFNIFCLFRNVSFDIIHTNSSATSLGGYLSNKKKIPHIWHIREYGKEDCNLEFYRSKKKIGRYMEKNSSLIIAISKDLKKYYSRYITSNMIEVIYNGIKIKEKPRKVLNIGRPLNICFLGLVHENKNQLEALKAVAYLLRKKKEFNFILNIAGSCQDGYLDLLKTYVMESGLENHVVFHGFVDDIDNFLNTMDVGVVSSKREAFGRVTVEFMMNNIPVIACNTGANKEIISSDNLGFIYEYGNYKELGDQLYDFIIGRNNASSIGENAYYHVVNNFSSELNTENIYRTYTKVSLKNE